MNWEVVYPQRDMMVWTVKSTWGRLLFFSYRNRGFLKKATFIQHDYKNRVLKSQYIRLFNKLWKLFDFSSEITKGKFIKTTRFDHLYHLATPTSHPPHTRTSISEMVCLVKESILQNNENVIKCRIPIINFDILSEEYMWFKCRSPSIQNRLHWMSYGQTNIWVIIFGIYVKYVTISLFKWLFSSRQEELLWDPVTSDLYRPAETCTIDLRN